MTTLKKYEEQELENKGIILSFEPCRLLNYRYWTAFSNTEDSPENYTIISYSLTALANKTKLTLLQSNFKNLDWYHALTTGWDMVLDKIKEIAEKRTIE